jgi:hypothetical protein
MSSGQGKDALNEANGADATRGERRVGPLLDRRADALTLTDEPIDKRLLTARGFGLSGARRKHAGRDPGVNHDERVAIEDAHEMGVPPDADPLAQQGERHWIKGAGHFDVPIGVDRAFAAGEERKHFAGKRAERLLLDLDKVRPDLAPRGAVDAQPRDCAIPVPQKRILRVEAFEAAAFERVVFDVAATALLLPVFLRRRGCVGSGVKPQCAANARYTS